MIHGQFIQVHGLVYNVCTSMDLHGSGDRRKEEHPMNHAPRIMRKDAEANMTETVDQGDYESLHEPSITAPTPTSKSDFSDMHEPTSRDPSPPPNFPIFSNQPPGTRCPEPVITIFPRDPL